MVNTLDFLEGMVEFLGIKVAMIPPLVSIPKLKGVTSINNTSLMASWSVEVKMAAYTAAP